MLPRLAFIDVETTGANPVVDRVTEIAILRVENGVLVERWSSLVNPGMGIPPSIQGFTGITDAMVAGAPQMRIPRYCRASVSTSTASHIALSSDGPTTITP